ncbi:DUF4062 domain-containing protein [Modestobacter sp. VKM Ac-2984]|uniref:DUF4062 domain-containing protein n=1 Tax=Modestobacter sp. VKM Ac-2984 TaxID=3004138 RepID=UPI0022AA481E|nr:DUF4062 domain-containing protein [Modestobacter sp. VKM Ac-2984]MCZ2816762.1 DUF4062 domain-containing protein [Modestobacter sp. VKM Ac-2984]
MTGKRYQVFLSSTFIDLEDERLAVTQAILNLRGIPAGMELFQASALPPWDVITPIIDSTDYFVLMLAGRYGSMTDGNISYTEREYDYAHARGIPVLAFTHGAPQDIPAKFVDTGRRAIALQTFRQKVSSRHTTVQWRDSAGLAQRVTTGLVNAFEVAPRPGYVRGGAHQLLDVSDQARTPSLIHESSAARQLPQVDPLVPRQHAFRYRSEYAWPPGSGGVPAGWSSVPLLMLRATAVLTPANVDTVERIRPEDRARLTAALDNAALSERLRNLFRQHRPASASGYLDAEPQALPAEWHLPPGGHQTTADATYRLGGDASSGVGSLITVTMPRIGRGDLVRITVDVAISVRALLSLVELATVLRDALSGAAVTVPHALASLFAPEAAVNRVELHLLADNADGQNQSRPNDLDHRVDWGPLGKRTRNFGRSLGTSVEVTGSLTERTTIDLVVGAIEQMVLDGGAPDPTQAVEDLRRALNPEA